MKNQLTTLMILIFSGIYLFLPSQVLAEYGDHYAKTTQGDMGSGPPSAPGPKGVVDGYDIPRIVSALQAGATLIAPPSLKAIEVPVGVVLQTTGEIGPWADYVYNKIDLIQYRLGGGAANEHVLDFTPSGPTTALPVVERAFFSGRATAVAIGHQPGISFDNDRGKMVLMIDVANGNCQFVGGDPVLACPEPFDSNLCVHPGIYSPPTPITAMWPNVVNHAWMEFNVEAFCQPANPADQVQVTISHPYTTAQDVAVNGYLNSETGRDEISWSFDPAVDYYAKTTQGDMTPGPDGVTDLGDIGDIVNALKLGPNLVAPPSLEAGSYPAFLFTGGRKFPVQNAGDLVLWNNALNPMSPTFSMPTAFSLGIYNPSLGLTRYGAAHVLEFTDTSNDLLLPVNSNVEIHGYARAAVAGVTSRISFINGRGTMVLMVKPEGGTCDYFGPDPVQPCPAPFGTEMCVYPTSYSPSTTITGPAIHDQTDRASVEFRFFAKCRPTIIGSTMKLHVLHPFTSFDLVATPTDYVETLTGRDSHCWVFDGTDICGDGCVTNSEECEDPGYCFNVGLGIPSAKCAGAKVVAGDPCEMPTSGSGPGKIQGECRPDANGDLICIPIAPPASGNLCFEDTDCPTTGPSSFCLFPAPSNGDGCDINCMRE